MQEFSRMAEETGMSDISEAGVQIAVGKGMQLEDRLRARIRAKGMAQTTEEAYAGWCRRYVIFHGKRHPEEMGAEEIHTASPVQDTLQEMRRFSAKG